MFANFATAIPTGAAVTFMLLFAMQSLIAMQPGLTADTTPNTPLVFLYVDPPDEINTKDFQPIDLPDIVHAPPSQSPEEYTSGGPGTGVTSIPLPPPGPNSTLNNPFTNDGPLMAIVRVEPTYPAIAANRGLEGFVVVQFDVLSDGTVGNISVVSSSSNIFERSAIKAASRFRFKARVVYGVPQTSSGVQYQFRFEMDH
jgi:protein TonB